MSSFSSEIFLYKSFVSTTVSFKYPIGGLIIQRCIVDDITTRRKSIFEAYHRKAHTLTVGICSGRLSGRVENSVCVESRRSTFRKSCCSRCARCLRYLPKLGICWRNLSLQHYTLGNLMCCCNNELCQLISQTKSAIIWFCNNSTKP